jgi:hypothetical protein
MTLSSFTRAYVAHDLGGDLHRLAQRAAIIAAALYVAGLAVGVVIHWANDWLSGDRRPWPVAWGVVDFQPSPVALVSSNEPAAWVKMSSPVWIVDESGRAGFVDLDFLSVTELLDLAIKSGLTWTKNMRPIRLANRAELIETLR